MDKKYIDLENLQLYHQLLMEYIEKRFGDFANAVVDLETGKITYQTSEEEKEDKYYYPIPFSLFEEGDKDE